MRTRRTNQVLNNRALGDDDELEYRSIFSSSEDGDSSGNSDDDFSGNSEDDYSDDDFSGNSEDETSSGNFEVEHEDVSPEEITEHRIRRLVGSMTRMAMWFRWWAIRLGAFHLIYFLSASLLALHFAKSFLFRVFFSCCAIFVTSIIYYFIDKSVEI